MPLARRLRPACLALLLCGPAVAQEPSAEPTPLPRPIVSSFVTRAGETINGEIIAADTAALLVRSGDAVPLRVEWTALPPETTFRLWRQALGETDAGRWIELGRTLKLTPGGVEMSAKALEVAVLLDPATGPRADEVRAMPELPAESVESAAPQDLPGEQSRPQAPPSNLGSWLALPDAAQMRRSGHTWGDVEGPAAEAAIAQAKAEAAEVEKGLGIKLTLVETEHFLYFTNVPPERTYHSPRLLDQMYDKACDLYGITRGTRLFKGKCPVYMLADRAEFIRFTQVFGGPAWAAGFCQQSTDGSVRIVMFQGEERGYTTHTMLHETMHGVSWRYRAPQFLPPWVEEGVAEWIATNTTGDRRYSLAKRNLGIARLRENPSLGVGMLGAPASSDNPGGGISEAWQYGIAYDMVATLQKRDPQAFVAFVNALKDGTDVAVAMHDHFGVSFDEFLSRYGRSIGVPNLTR